MKILAKMLLSFVSIAILCGVVGIFGLTQLNNLSQNLTQLSDQTIPALDYMNIIDASFKDIKTAIRSLSVSRAIDNTEYYDRQINNIEKARTNYKEALEKYTALPKVAEEERLFTEASRLLDQAAAYNNKVIDLAIAARKGSEEERVVLFDQIYNLISSDDRLAYDNMVASMTKLLDYDRQYYGVELPQEAINSAIIGKMIVLIVTIFSFIVALICGIWQGLSIAGRLSKTVKILDKIAHGDLKERLEIKTSDEFSLVAASLNGVEANVSALVKDTDRLVQAALEGNLSVRADAAQHEGDYRKVIEGLNATLEAVVSPLTMAANYIDKIAKGNLPPKITETYNGEYNKIKENLNIAIDSINALVADTVVLSNAAVEGNLQTRADATKHEGDYRKIIEGINNTLDLMITPVNEVIEVLKRLAEGDMTLRMTGEYRGDFDILKSSLNNSLDSINDTLGQINTAVEQVAEGSVQVSQASQSLSQGATEQAASLEEITSSTTEISGQTKQNTENAVKMNSLASEAQENAEKGNNQMKELVSAMSDINTSAEGIKKVVKTIDDISFQINLLALNANVEAARAGKYGKGFAVVAEEVRNLAVRSANSVKETTRMVEEAISNIQRGNTLVEGTANQLDEIVGGAGQVATISEEVAAAGREQTQGLEQIALGLNQIDQVTQSNTASAEESASASEELSSQAQQVKSMLARFKLKKVENSLNNAEVLAMLRTELSNREHKKKLEIHAEEHDNTQELTGAHHLAAASSGLKQTGHAEKSVLHTKHSALNPADIISLDDSNFGKF